MQEVRLSQSHLVQCPHLVALDINVGSFRTSHIYPSLQEWEKREQIRFRVRRSKRGDEAKAGLATVSCVELDELTAKLGTGPVSKRLQERLLQEVRERAEDGLVWKRDTRLDREGSSRFAENDFRILLDLERHVPFLWEEEEWVPKTNEG